MMISFSFRIQRFKENSISVVRIWQHADVVAYTKDVEIIEVDPP